jgi:hypothetical protein
MLMKHCFTSWRQSCLGLWAALMLVSGAQTAHAATWTIQPDCTGQTRCFTHPQALYNWSAIAPGDVVQLMPDAQGSGWLSRLQGAAALSIDLARGTAQQHITVVAVNGAKLLQGVNVSRSQFLDLIALDVSENRSANGAGSSAITIQGGSSDISVQASRIHHATEHGVNVTSTAGPRVSIGPNNGIYSNQFAGVAVHASGATLVNGMSAISSQVYGNLIGANGLHGVDVEASYWRVSYNQVMVNGLNSGGSSGVHLFSRTDQAGPDCDFNEVSYNHISGQRDSTLSDGNGIQSDHFCDRNLIAFNVVWGNAGAGVSLIAGRGNIVALNTLYNNAADQNRASTPALRGELIVASWADFCWNGYIDPASCKVPAGRASGNLIMDNLIQSNQAAVPAMLFNADAIDASRGNVQSVYPNLMFNNMGGANLRWGARSYTNAGDIDRVIGLSAMGGGTLVEPPAFVDPANPGPATQGLRLRTKPSLAGWAIGGLPDLLDAQGGPGDAFLGAYFTKP